MRSSSRRSRRSTASSQPRLLRELLPPGTPPARPVDARRRSAPPVPVRGRSAQPVSVRERSPLDQVRQEAPPPTRTVIARQPVAPSPQTLPAPSPQRSQILPLMDIDTSARAPVTAVHATSVTRQEVPTGLARRARTPVRSPSPQPSTSTGIRHLPPRFLGSSESTITAPSPSRQDGRDLSPSPEVIIMGPPPSRRAKSPEVPPRRPRGPAQAPPPPRTPPRLVPEILQLPRTPGHFSSPESDPGLDLTRMPRTQHVDIDSQAEDDSQWDKFSSVPEAPAPLPQPPQETLFSWGHVVELVYNSGMVDVSALPPSPEPVRSVIGEPQAVTKKKLALPPSPLVAASLPAAMRSCWGGTWSSHAQHQPPPPNAALHPGPATWVPGFKPKFHAAPGLDLRPARPSAREREWAGSSQPPVEHSWLVDIDTVARAQLATLSNLEWLFGIYLDSQPRASQADLDVVRGFIVRELHLAINFSGAQVAAATLARRKAILDSLQHQLSQTTRNWLQLQPVELRTDQGLFGPASALVPEIIRQQPVPRPSQQPRRRAARFPRRREPAREPQAPQAQSQAQRAPAATFTPTAAAAPAPPRANYRPRGRGGQQPSGRGARAPKQQQP